MAELGGVDIGSVIRSTGPVVKCVLLRATDNAGDDADKEPGSNDGSNADLIEQIEVDTTPKKAMVSHILGGPFTFLGQYEEEGVMVMILRPDSFDEPRGHDEDDEKKGEVQLPPINPHRLQPPLHKKEVRGNILLMRVAPSAEEDELEEKDPAATAVAATAISNDEFFLDYTRDEYLKFAVRTDIPEHEVDEGDDDAEEEEEKVDEDAEGPDDDGDEESDEEFGEEDIEDDDDEDDGEFDMTKLLLDSCLRRFKEENDRDPDAQELHEIRKALAEKLGVDLPPVDGADLDKEEEEERTNEDDNDAKAKEDQPSDAAKEVAVENDVGSTKSPQTKCGEKRSVVSPDDNGGDSEERARKRANAGQRNDEPITCH